MTGSLRAVSIISDNGTKREEKTIPELSETDVEGLNSIGAASGQDIFHCLYLAGRHATGGNFFKRVVGYRILGPSEYGIKVQFFEKK